MPRGANHLHARSFTLHVGVLTPENLDTYNVYPPDHVLYAPNNECGTCHFIKPPVNKSPFRTQLLTHEPLCSAICTHICAHKRTVFYSDLPIALEALQNLQQMCRSIRPPLPVGQQLHRSEQPYALCVFPCLTRSAVVGEGGLEGICMR